MTHDELKLTQYFGERDRDDGRLLAGTALDAFARRGLRTSVLLRGAAGFGLRHHLRTDRLLTLSEDLPLVATAVDRPAPIIAAAEEAAARSGGGLITLEHATTGPPVPADDDEVKLTVHLTRGARIDRRAAYVALVAALRRHGVAGASVLLGVDGTAHGRRRRARFAGANGHVPLVVVSIGDAGRIAAAVAELDDRLGEPPRTVERVRVCKRDGVRLGGPHSGPEGWVKLTVVCGEQSRHEGRPLADAIVRALRVDGAAGATAMRGVWGYHGEHDPHGDRLVQLRRRVPMLVETVDTPERSAAAFAAIDRLTATDGLVLSAPVPAFLSSGPGVTLGSLEL